MQSPRDARKPRILGQDRARLTAAALFLVVSLAAAPPVSACDAGCERRAAEELLSRRQILEAVERLRVAVSRFPDDPVLPFLLARSYLLERNLFWAEKTLQRRLESAPGDGEARHWLACVHLRQGDLDLARETLALAPPASDGLSRSRRALLEAFSAQLGTDPARARTALAEIGPSSGVFPEDLAVWSLLQRRLDPWWMDPFKVDVEAAGGYTSNALAGAPTDPGASGTASALADIDLRARVAPRVSPSLRPVLEVDIVGHGLTKEAYRELSSLETSARAGALVTLGRYRTLLGYRAEVLFLNQTPSRYSEAHRGEIEIESARGWVVFGGAGHRAYRDERRTRSEWDLGIGGPTNLIPRTSLLLGATLRGGSALSPAYDFFGASLAAAARIGLPGGLSIRLSATASLDDYPHSGGLEGQIAFGTAEKRRDLLGRATVGIWLPERRGLRIGVEGEFARRDSTADSRPGSDFDYTEMQGRVVVRFTFGANPSAPHVARSAGHVPLEWGLDSGTDAESERIIDLLRQDEELRRGSSCGL